jgi:beta-lactamase regulating signal transducer with metallopeptidase domain
MRTLDGLLLTFLVNALWQIPLVAGAASLGDRFLRRSPARHRHTLWLATLSLCLLLPAASLLPQGEEPKALEKAPPAAKRGETGGAAGWLAFGGEHRPALLTVPAAPAVALLYGLSVAISAVRLGRMWRRTRLLGRRAVPLAIPEEVSALVARCREALGTGPVTLLSSREVAGPVTLGRAIVLPPGFLASSSPDELAAALGHELAHVRRRDYAVNFASEILLVPVAFHPAARLVRRRLVLTREIAADEAAIGTLIGARAYARSLLALASSMAGLSRPSFTLGVSDAHTLEVRMRQILDRRPRLGARPARAALAATVLLLAGLGLAASGLAVDAAGARAEDFAGTWKGVLHFEPGKAVPGIDLTVKTAGGRPDVQAIFYRHQRSADGSLTTTPEAARVLRPEIRGGRLVFWTRTEKFRFDENQNPMEQEWAVELTGSGRAELHALRNPYWEAAKKRGENVPPPPPSLPLERQR